MQSKTVSIRLPVASVDQVERAARRAKKSVNDYLASIVAPWAASDLGEPVPQKPAPAPVKRSPVTEAAAIMGLPRDRFRQLAAERVAADMLAQLHGDRVSPVPEAPRQKPSGFFKRTA